MGITKLPDMEGETTTGRRDLGSELLRTSARILDTTSELGMHQIPVSGFKKICHDTGKLLSFFPVLTCRERRWAGPGRLPRQVSHVPLTQHHHHHHSLTYPKREVMNLARKVALSATSPWHTTIIIVPVLHTQRERWWAWPGRLPCQPHPPDTPPPP